MNYTVTNVTTYGGSDGAISITVADGTTPYQYIWNTGATTQNLLNIPAGSYMLTVTDSTGCLITGSIQVTQPPPPTTQNINIPSGWSIFSTYIVPAEPDISIVVASILAHIIIVKDGSGNVFWPQYGINNIVDMIIGKGYQIKTNAACTLSITGNPVVPENTPLSLNAGWSIIGYLRQTSAPIAVLLGGIVNNVLIVKNGAGNVYWPYYGVNNMINMNPGEGYIINVTLPTVLTYSAN
jgi:hypothetical protein